MKNILYIHGFMSSCKSSKIDALRKGNNVYCIQLDNKPKEDISKLTKFMKNNKIDLVVGTSLGGFYSLYLNAKFDVQIIAMNPVTYPSKQLEHHLGENVDFLDRKFSWTKEDLKYLSKLESNIMDIDKLKSFINIFVNVNDSVIDVKDIENKFKYTNIFKFDSSDHRFSDNFNKVLEYIKTI
jgi:predicted esterase YcpF (UPF0227 family)